MTRFYPFLAALALVGCNGSDKDDTDSDSDTDTDTDDTDTDDTDVDTTPLVIATNPEIGEVDVVVNISPSATFSEPMDAATVNEGTFTVTFGSPPVGVGGRVVYSDAKASFWPDANLPMDTVFTATIAGDVESMAGVPLGADTVWTFTTGQEVALGVPVDLGSAAEFAILAKAAISTVPPSAVTGHVGVSPAAATFITGFSLTVDPSNEFSMSKQVNGRVYAADYAVPTPALLTTAIGDMELAFTAAAGRAPEVTEFGAGDIGGANLAPGVYKWGTGLLVPTDVTLTGTATDVWVFEIAQDLTVSSGARVVLAGGARPENVFWQVSGLVDLGTTSHIEGTILSQTAITLHTGASVNGRLLAQTAVALDAATVVRP